MERRLDWRGFLNRLVFCYGCGRFGLPPKGTTLPKGWTVLYQPHGDGPVGLHVCSESCKEKVRIAMTEGTVREPIVVVTDVVMTIEMREQMMAEAMAYAMSEEGAMDRVFAESMEGVDGGEEICDEEDSEV